MKNFSIEKAKNKQYYVKFKANNGESIFTSETYTRKVKAKKAIAVIATYFDFAEVQAVDNTTPGLPTEIVIDVAKYLKA